MEEMEDFELQKNFDRLTLQISEQVHYPKSSQKSQFFHARNGRRDPEFYTKETPDAQSLSFENLCAFFNSRRGHDFTIADGSKLLPGMQRNKESRNAICYLSPYISEKEFYWLAQAFKHYGINVLFRHGDLILQQGSATQGYELYVFWDEKVPDNFKFIHKKTSVIFYMPEVISIKNAKKFLIQNQFLPGEPREWKNEVGRFGLNELLKERKEALKALKP